MWHRLACVSFVIATPAPATVLTLTDAGEILVAHEPRSSIRTTLPQVPAPLPSGLAQPVAEAAARAQLARQLIAAVAWVESRFRADAISPAGARGLMQLMPGTARELGVDARDPAANLAGGAAYLRRLLDRFDGDLVLALAAYNAGPGAVERHRGVPPYPETRAYVARVLTRLAATALAPEVTP